MRHTLPSSNWKTGFSGIRLFYSRIRFGHAQTVARLPFLQSRQF
jgi:hypothetical protein